LKYLFDEYTWTENRKVLTASQLNIPGLEVFGHSSSAYGLTVLPVHAHVSAEFVYVANGAQKYYIEDREYILTGNQVLMVNAHTPHSTGSNPYGRYENFWFRLDIGEFANSLPLQKEIAEYIYCCLNHTNELLFTMRENVYNDLQTMFRNLASEDVPERLAGYAGFLDFIVKLARYTQLQERNSPQVQQAISYINENICTQIQLEDLAKRTGLSLSGFKQKFRRETGISPREYINTKKIEKAKEMLKSGKTVTDTAYALEFSSSSYFSALFKQRESITPSEYKAQNED